MTRQHSQSPSLLGLPQRGARVQGSLASPAHCPCLRDLWVSGCAPLLHLDTRTPASWWQTRGAAHGGPSGVHFLLHRPSPDACASGVPVARRALLPARVPVLTFPFAMVSQMQEEHCFQVAPIPVPLPLLRPGDVTAWRALGSERRKMYQEQTQISVSNKGCCHTGCKYSQAFDLPAAHRDRRS